MKHKDKSQELISRGKLKKNYIYKGFEMSIGFILIKSAPAFEYEVYNKLLKIREIKELHPLFGEYDLIAKIEAEDFEKLGEIVISKIRSVKGVLDTKTLTGTKF